MQILTPAGNTVNSNQTVVLPTSSGALTLLQQGAVQQVLLPSNFNTGGMVNLKTLQGLKVIPISAQNAGVLKGTSFDIFQIIASQKRDLISSSKTFLFNIPIFNLLLVLHCDMKTFSLLTNSFQSVGDFHFQIRINKNYFVLHVVVVDQRITYLRIV